MSEFRYAWNNDDLSSTTSMLSPRAVVRLPWDVPAVGKTDAALSLERLMPKVGALQMSILDFDISVQNAKIVTLGERVDDVFVITDANNQELSDPQLCERLQQTIIDTLSSTQPTGQEYSSPIAIGP